MAGEIGEAYIRIRPNTTGFGEEMSSGVKRGIGGVGKILGGAFAAAGILETVKHVAGAAADQQVQLAQVRRSVQDANAAWIVHGKTVSSILLDNAKKTGFTVLDETQSFRRLEAGLGNTNRALHGLREAQNLARASGIDLSTASLVVDRALLGSTTSLRRYGVIIKPVTTEEDALKRQHDELAIAGVKLTKSQNEQYKTLLEAAKAHDKLATSTRVDEELQRRFSGQSQVYARSASGAFAILRGDVSSFEVSIGRVLLPTLVGGARGLGVWLGELEHSQGLHQAVAGSVHLVTDAFSTMKEVVETIGPPLVAITGDLVDVAKAIGAPAIIAGIATFKGVEAAAVLATTAEAFYAKTVAGGIPATEAQTAANTELAASQQAVAATGVEASGAAGIGAFARGLVGLVSPTTLVAIGLAGIAGALAYTLSNVTGFDGAVKSLEADLELLNDTMDKTRDIANQVAESKIGVKLARDARDSLAAQLDQDKAREKATRHTKEHAAAVLQERTTVDQLASANQSLREARQRVGDATRAQTKHERDLHDAQLKTIRGTVKTVKEGFESETRILGPIGVGASQGPRPGSAVRTIILEAEARKKIEQALLDGEKAVRKYAAAHNEQLQPGIIRSLEAMRLFVGSTRTKLSPIAVDFLIKHPPSTKQIAELKGQLGQVSRAAAVQAVSLGVPIGANLDAGIRAGILAHVGEIASVLPQVINEGVISPAKAAGEMRSPSRLTYREIGVPLMEGVAAGIVAGAPSAAQAMKDSLIETVQQGADTVIGAVEQAKSNLSGISGSLADAIIGFRNAPGTVAPSDRIVRQINEIEKKIAAGTATAQQRIRASQLAAQLQATQASQGQLTQVQQDAIHRRTADLAVEFDTHLISRKRFIAENLKLARQEGFNFAAIRKRQGLAVAVQDRAIIQALGLQTAATLAGPQLKGTTGFEPQIIRPLDALRSAQLQYAQAQLADNKKLLAEAKAQVAAARRAAAAAEKGLTYQQITAEHLGRGGGTPATTRDKTRSGAGG